MRGQTSIPSALIPPDETQLWHRLWTGDRDALSELYDRHARVLHRYGRRIIHDDQTIWDAIHDVFVDVWKYRQTLTVETDGRYYLFRALRNRLLRQVAQATRWTGQEPEPAEDFSAETDEALRRALAELTPRHAKARE